MTAAPNLVKIDVVCICCNARTEIWIVPEEIKPPRMVWSPLDNAYLHTCGKCLYQRTDEISKQLRHSGPERSTHSRRASGAVHTIAWRRGA